MADKKKAAAKKAASADNDQFKAMKAHRQAAQAKAIENERR